VTAITVVIPAYNAAATLDATTDSVRLQTYEQLEILIIDDGSTDETMEIAQRHAAEDPRIRVISQPNGGVASARNRGLAEASSELVALVDADDVWHPEKIERQVRVIEANPEMSLVCTGYSVIDEVGRVVQVVGGSTPKRVDFLDLCRRNFIGNGSSALMRRAEATKFGGYDATLRERGGQGCEDLKLYLQMAENSVLGFIPLPLTGYRQTRGNMSSDGAQMLRSFDLVADEFSARRPELRPLFNCHRSYMSCWLAHRAVGARRWKAAGRLMLELVSRPSPALPDAVLTAVRRRMGKALSSSAPVPFPAPLNG
jgi:glycosyltransferase involved in cell wall biosynthesis